MGGEVKSHGMQWAWERRGSGPLGGKASSSWWSRALRGQLLDSADVTGPPASGWSRLCPCSTPRGRRGLREVWERAAAGGEGIWRDLSGLRGLHPVLTSLPCRPRCGQGHHAYFPPGTETRKDQTSQKWGHPRLYSSVWPVGPGSSRGGGQKSAACPPRKVSLGSVDCGDH